MTQAIKDGARRAKAREKKADAGGKRAVADGHEIETAAPVKVTHYLPRKGVGRMHMSVTHGTWSREDLGLSGSIYVPMGSADSVVTVSRDGDDGTSHLFTFDARSMIDLAVKMFMGGVCPRCSGPAFVVDKAPAGESGDVVRCPTCDKRSAS